MANLYNIYKNEDLLTFVNAPVGKGQTVTQSLKPLIAIPTTAGTGSETTGQAIYDHNSLNAKTGISSRALRPTLGIVDVWNTDTCPTPVHISAGLDVVSNFFLNDTIVSYLFNFYSYSMHLSLTLPLLIINAHLVLNIQLKDLLIKVLTQCLVSTTE